MSEPLILKGYVSVSIIQMTQSLLPAAVAAATLRVLAGQMGLLPSDRYTLLLGLVVVSTFLVVRPHGTLASILVFKRLALMRSLLWHWGLNLVLLYVFITVTGLRDFYPNRLLLSWALLTPLLLLLVALPIQTWFRAVLVSRENTKRAIIAGCNDASQSLAAKLKSMHLMVDGFFDDRSPDRLGVNVNMPLLGRLPDLVSYVRAHAVDVIFIALPMRHVQRVLDMLSELRDTTASIYYVPDIFVFDLIQARTADVLGIPVVAMCETPLAGYGGMIKRLTDIAFSIIALVVLLPVLILAAIAIATTSRGPVIFRQRRYGIDAREIVVYKFRTMAVTEDGPTIKQATKGDTRVTAVGRILRRTSIDELPQLINVLQGRMSLVGPRPHAVAHNEEYRRLITGYMIRHKVPPGMTGLAQVNGCRGELTRLEDMQARLHYDLEYLRHWSWMLDMKVLLRTVVMVFGDKKAY